MVTNVYPESSYGRLHTDKA